MNEQVKRELRSTREIRKMRKAGLVVWEAHQAAAKILKPGVSTATINQVYQDTFRRHQATSLFLNYGGQPGVPPFPAETCISINDEVVHGIPGPRTVESGDIVSLDTGCKIDGWCGDAAVTHALGEMDPVSIKLLKVTNDVLNLAIDLMATQNLWSEVASEMETFVNDAGFFVVKEMVGHGIGKQLHEPPQVPNYFNFDIHDDFELKPGVVLAVEPMVNVGTSNLLTLDDGWTTVTADRQNSAHFEHTIAITKDGPIRLTGPPNDSEIDQLPEDLRNPDEWVLW
ncbi:MAG: type I methionyl aminopeptidase [Planctomycetota bacterium]